MTEQEVEEIALESIEIREQRTKLKAVKKAIEESLDACANVAMRKELRAFAGESLGDFDDNSEDEDATGSRPQNSRLSSRKPIAEAANASPAKQPRRVSQQPASGPQAGNPYDAEAANNIRRGAERASAVPSDWDDGHVAQQYNGMFSQNQYAQTAAPQYTAPPPPPPRPAKVPAPGAQYDAPPSPAESMNQANLGRYAFSAQDLNAARTNEESGAKRSGRKISNLLRGQA